MILTKTESLPSPSRDRDGIGRREKMKSVNAWPLPNEYRLLMTLLL